MVQVIYFALCIFIQTKIVVNNQCKNMGKNTFALKTPHVVFLSLPWQLSYIYTLLRARRKAIETTMKRFWPGDLNLWPWPSNLTWIICHLSSMPKFKFICMSVQPAEWDKRTPGDGHTHTQRQTDRKSQSYYTHHVRDGGSNEFSLTPLVEFVPGNVSGTHNI